MADIAFTDTAQIRIPGLKFVNAGIGGSDLHEQLGLLRASHLDRLKLVVIGMIKTDINEGSCDEPSTTGSGSDDGSKFWDPIRFSVSWKQFGYALGVLQQSATREPAEL